jgi:hypothetical protein
MECRPFHLVSAAKIILGTCELGKSSQGGGEEKWNVFLFSVCQSSKIILGAYELVQVNLRRIEERRNGMSSSSPCAIHPRSFWEHMS